VWYVRCVFQLLCANLSPSRRVLYSIAGVVRGGQLLDRHERFGCGSDKTRRALLVLERLH
jgi:hypothetical protein